MQTGFMNMRALGLGVLLLGIGADATGLILLGMDNARLERRISELHRQNEQADRTREAVRHTQRLLAQAGEDQVVSAREIHAELERARDEVAGLEALAQEKREKKAAQVAAQAAMDASSLAGNVNPESGMTRLEAFQNVGFHTPGAALQTLVWAALKGDISLLSGGGLAVSGATQERAEALIAALPENVRTEWTPEKLAALWWTQAITEVSAAQVTDLRMEDASHATLAVRGGIGANGLVSMRLGPAGWQMVVPVQAMEQAEARLNPAPKN